MACSIILVEIVPQGAYAKGSAVKVVFLGFRYENVSPEMQNRIEVRILGMLYQKESVQVLSPSQAVQLLGSERVNTVLTTSSTDSLRSVCSSLNADYVITGQLKTLGRDTVRPVLEGQIIRYDKQEDGFRTVDVLRHYDEFDLVLADIQRNLIDTINSGEQTFLQRYMPLIAVGLVVVGGFILLLTSSTSSSNSGTSKGGTPTPN